MSKRRSNNEGSVYFDKSKKRWFGQVSLGIDPITGVRKYAKCSGRNKTAALDALKALKAEIESGTRTSRTYTLQMALDNWTGTLTGSPNTVAQYTNSARQIVKLIGPARLIRDVTAAEVLVALTTFAEHRAQATVAHAKTKITQVFAHADLGDYVKPGVAAKIAQLPAPKGQAPGNPTRELTLAQAHVLVKIALEDLTWLGPYTTLSLLDLGARPDEARALRWADVEGGVLWITHSARFDGKLKTVKSERYAPLCNVTVKALAAHRVRQEASGLGGDEDLIFTADGGPLGPAPVRKAFGALTDKAGLGTKFTPRSLRHSFGMILRDLGVPVDDVKDALGHVHSDTAGSVYLNHPIDRALVVAVEAINAEFPAE
jgi:integrase